MLDEAAIDFTKTFYDRLIRGMTICEAFDAAKADVEFKHKAVEASIFMIFKSSSHKNKDCSRHPQREFGPMKCISDHSAFKEIPTKLSNILFRDKEISELIENVMNGERLVILLGLHGFGKSSIARNALHYMSERKFFTGGIILVQMKNVEKVFTLLK